MSNLRSSGGVFTGYKSFSSIHERDEGGQEQAEETAAETQNPKALLFPLDPLRAYVERRNMPFKALENVSQMFDRLTHTRDNVFVDMRGRLPGDEGYFDGLLSFQFTDMAVHICLLLGANMDGEANLNLFRKCGELRFDSPIFPKTDEATRFGSPCNLADVTDPPVACPTHGQQVPDNIPTPTPMTLVNLDLGGQWT